MATGGGLALPEPLQDEDSHSWFKRFEVCAAANGWDGLLCFYYAILQCSFHYLIMLVYILM